MSWNADLAVLVDTELSELDPTGRTAEIDAVGSGEVAGWQVGRNVVLFAGAGTHQ